VDPALNVLLLSWAWRPEIILTLLLAAILHLAGRWQLHRRSRRRVVSPWRTLSYFAGLVVLAVALMSPIDVLSGQFFYMHMIQHLLLVMVAPVLLLLADPFPIAMWGLPATLRLEIGRFLRPGAKFRAALRTLTSPGLVWLYSVAVLIGWHDPWAYNLTLESDLAHDLEHLSFFVTATLFWWHVIGAAPHIHRTLSRGMRAGYVLSIVPATAITGAAISFASEPIYTYYTRVPRLGTMSVVQDQMLGGVIMWVPGSMMYIIAALILLAQLIRAAETAAAQAGTRPPGDGGRSRDNVGLGVSSTALEESS
jgi:cytochrome c oxidase assembly factor CtaG